MRFRLYFLDRPFRRPRGASVLVDSIDALNDHAVGGDDIRQYAALTDKVADHYEATATAVECTEQCFLDPFCQTLYTVGIEHEFVIVQIVDNDIVGAVAAVTQTARRLPTSACEKGAAVAGYERTLLPRSLVLLCTEVGDIPLVELQLRLYVAQQRIRHLLRLTYEYHYI